MLKKRIGRVRRKKGAILFAVIAIMSLLIAMASTAYYTARSAYNSVVSNYDYSQLYLSAISVSDMVLEAISNDPLDSATANNDYAALSAAIQALPKYDSTNEAGTVLRASSTNISNAAASRAAILSELQGKDSTIAGALDGIVLEIKLKDEKVISDGSVSTPQEIKDKLLADLKQKLKDQGIPASQADAITSYQPAFIDCTYSIVTTAYYRDNIVQVEDIISMMRYEAYKGDGYSKQTSHNGEGGGGGFSTFFTATGQVLDSDGDIERTSRKVVINTHEISDDTFFQNDRTYLINSDAGNMLKGSLSTTGSLYVQKATCDIQGSDNDWYIGKDLVLMHDNAGTLDLTNNGSYDNSLFVGGNLVLGSGNGYGVRATDIYVNGDLYLCGGAGSNINITGNLYVNGNIYYEMPDTGNTAAAVAKQDGYPFQSLKYAGYDKVQTSESGAVTPDVGLNISGTLSVSDTSIVTAPAGSTNPAKITSSAGSTVIATGGKIKETAGSTVGSYDASKPVTIVSSNPNYETNKFDTVETQSTVSGAIKQAQTNTEYDSYTAPQTAYDDVIRVDLSKLELTFDNGGNISSYEWKGDSRVVIEMDVPTTVNNIDGLKVTLPYESDGYSLDISNANTIQWKTMQDQILKNPDGSNQTDQWGNPVWGKVEVVKTQEVRVSNYNIQTGAEAVPIVLLPNITSPKLDDETADIPGFSWMGDNYAANGKSTDITAIGSGNVVLEMANYKIDENGAPIMNGSEYTYAPYDPTKANDFATVRYVAAAKETVGNEKQVELINEGNMTVPNIDQNGVCNNKDNDMATMLGDANGDGIPDDSVPEAGYHNQFMLVSNTNNGVAVDTRSNGQNSAFCGYVYAPNGEYDNYSGTGSQPVFGGMIVSTYNTKLAKLYYAEPLPSAIADMLKSLDLWKDGGGGDPVDPNEYEDKKEANAHSSDFGELEYIGSNYLG